jgi:hypothetical protein
MKHLLHHIPPQAIKFVPNPSALFIDVPDKMKGYMSMRMSKKIAPKQSYFFFLENKALKYYNNKEDASNEVLQGVIDFDMYRCSIEGVPLQENTFILNVGNPRNVQKFILQVIPDPEIEQGERRL